MSINATQYIEMRDGLPTIVPTPQGTRGEMMPIGTPALIRIVVDSGETGDGVSFLAWLRDKIRADQEAAKAWDVVPIRTAEEFGAAQRVPEFAHACVRTINEGDTAPSADVVSIAESQFRIP